MALDVKKILLVEEPAVFLSYFATALALGYISLSRVLISCVDCSLLVFIACSKLANSATKKLPLHQSRKWRSSLYICLIIESGIAQLITFVEALTSSHEEAVSKEANPTKDPAPNIARLLDVAPGSKV